MCQEAISQEGVKNKDEGRRRRGGGGKGRRRKKARVMGSARSSKDNKRTFLRRFVGAPSRLKSIRAHFYG